MHHSYVTKLKDMKKMILRLGILSLTLLTVGFANAQVEAPLEDGIEKKRKGGKWKAMDTNNDRLISLDEFMSFDGDKKHPERTPKLSKEEKFAKIDKDGDGQLSKPEIKALRARHKARKEKRG